MHFTDGGLLVCINFKKIIWNFNRKLILISGQVITAAYVPLVNYHNLFSDAAYAANPLTTRRWEIWKKKKDVWIVYIKNKSSKH